jgi:NADPH-dependent glutamate synthase beta subunit-like oxidoreductase
VHVEWQGGKMVEVPGTEKEWKADLVLLAMGFVSPVASVLEAFGVEKDAAATPAGTEERRLPHQRRQGVRRRRHAARPEPGGVGDPRRPAGRARGRRVPDGREHAAALSVCHSSVVADRPSGQGARVQ